VVSEADLGVNFFLDGDSLGKMRAPCSTELLLELNPEVQGDWYPKSEVWTKPPVACQETVRCRHDLISWEQ
jgi:hypothetical protein